MPTAPIGIFDSGIGGLSILHALRCLLPAERFVYLADSAHAPYGDARSRSFVQQRACTIATHLRAQHGIKALVIACNTATVAAASLLRAEFALLPIVGVEPALKPAAACTRSGHVGVLATRSTLASPRFARLLAQQASGGVRFHLQPCAGLAQAVECAFEHPEASSTAHNKHNALCLHYARQLGPFGSGSGQIDTLVLGCTHYAFCLAALRHALGRQVLLLHPADAVARQTQRLLAQNGCLAAPAQNGAAPALHLLDSGGARLAALERAARQWLPGEALRVEVAQV